MNLLNHRTARAAHSLFVTVLIALLLTAPAWGQYDGYETFEGGVCVDTWVGGCPSTISADTGLSGSYNVLNPGITIFKEGVAASSACMSFEYRKPGNPGTNQVIFETRAASTLDLWQAFHLTTGVLRVTSRGGTTINLATLSNDTKYTVEICYEQGTVNDTKVKARLNSDSFTETTDGDEELAIDDFRIRANSLDGERFDEIKICLGTYVGVSECDPPVRRKIGLSYSSRRGGRKYPSGALQIVTTSLPGAVEEEAYSETVGGTGGTAPYTWSILSGSLPASLSLASGTGIISGTLDAATAGTYSFIVRVTDDVAATADQELSIEVEAAGGTPQQPWERDFTPLRTHYVGPTAAGTGTSDCNNRESFTTARGHAIAGDRHILCAGTYAGNFDLTTNGTSAAPIEWKCDIDANGNPADAYIDGSLWLEGTWNWVNCLRFGDTDNSHATRTALHFSKAGSAVINAIVQRHSNHAGLDSQKPGSDIVIYGYTAIDNGWNDTTYGSPRHNLYTQNVVSNGTMYIVQMTSLDTSIDPPTGTGRAVFHANVSGTSEASLGQSNLSGYHVQDSTFQRGMFNWVTHTSYAGGQPSHSNTLSNLWVDDVRYRDKGFQVGNQGWGAIDIQDSLITGTKLSFRVWGAGDDCWPYQNPSKFLNNRIYDPYQGVYINEFTTRRADDDGTPPCTRITGTPKLRDVDDVNNNDYRRTTAGTFNLNANGNNSTGNTFAQWKTKTSAARETPGTSYDAASTESTSLPTVDEVECFANFYQPNWGKCRAKDWDGNGSITIPGVQADKIVGNGKTYTVRNERDFRGTALKTGTYTAGAGIASITVPGDAVNGYLLVWITSQP